MIFALARRQLATRYIGTIGGPVWTVAQPIATVVVFWVVFSLGFRAHGPGQTPFLLYFLPAYIAWLLFSEIVMMSTGAVVGNAHLVKKTLFPVEVLPLVNVLSASVPHAVLIVVTLAFVLIQGYAIPASVPAVLYLYVAIVTLAVGISWVVSSLNVFYRDVEQVVTVLMNLWFWATPIAWPADVLPKHLSWLLAANPMYFIAEGYRAALVGIPPLQFDPLATVTYWFTAAAIFLLGIFVFRGLKPEFPELL